MWILEQPASSMMSTHPSMVWARARALELNKTWHIVSTYQGAFGAETLKKTILASNSLCTHLLVRGHPGHGGPRSSTAKDSSVRDCGRRMVTVTDGLKGTQTYSPEFGAAVAAAFSEESFFNDIDAGNAGVVGQQEVSRHEAFEDANLELVACALRDADHHLLRRLRMLPKPPRV